MTLFEQELESQLRHCKDEFKEFERQDVKHREDLKHLKQKLKKLDDKIDKVILSVSFQLLKKTHRITFSLQDSAKITDITKECEESTNLIPRLEEEIPKLQKILLDEEKVLEEIREKAKGCCFHYRYLVN